MFEELTSQMSGLLIYEGDLLGVYVIFYVVRWLFVVLRDFF